MSLDQSSNRPLKPQSMFNTSVRSRTPDAGVQRKLRASPLRSSAYPITSDPSAETARGITLDWGRVSSIVPSDSLEIKPFTYLGVCNDTPYPMRYVASAETPVSNPLKFPKVPKST